ncbi:prevent-host-death protein [Methylophaga sp. OBS4]|uniref:prevent-host-death protein n=1 Tax=Methylophaga sp. OBS4 TaxID=2991935 RepID=UPI0022551986|nr:prevent-host-death protein [Methylophaga sp. OBS4]MCX4187665.1 type II toxin-antitoxin system Phd/YefM family antitoxin [Methylophaga sp. OBS4]
MITANDIKTKGVSSVEEALRGHSEAMITVRGKQKYVVMRVEDYQQLREAELEAALWESRRDIENKAFKTQSVAEHIQELFD